MEGKNKKSKKEKIPKDAVVIQNQRTGRGLVFGGVGLKVAGIVSHQGNYESVSANIENYNMRIITDLPFCLPIEEKKQYTIIVNNVPYFIFHCIKKRGEETFSTFNTTMLPHFSEFLIIGNAFKEVLDENQHYSSHKIIIDILRKLNSFFEHQNCQLNFLKGIPELGYYIQYFEKSDPIHSKYLVAEASYPYSGIICIEGPQKNVAYDDEKLRHFLTEKIKIQTHAEQNILPVIQDMTFCERIFQATHDFAYYCCQHSKGLHELDESHIRDLFLVIIKSIFHYAEGEVFICDGKLDYKITNPNNKYEHIHGEFKWWNKENDLKEIFHQLIRKHSTGQEKEAYLIILSRNKDANKLYEKIIMLIQKENELIKKIDKKITPQGSKEKFNEYLVKVKGNELPLKVGLINLYYENV